MRLIHQQGLRHSQTELQDALDFQYVSDELERYSAIRDHKETVTYSGFAFFVTTCSIILHSADWPPTYLKNTLQSNVAIIIIFSGFAIGIYYFLRHQLRARKWAALRVSGCSWFLAEFVKAAYSDPIDLETEVQKLKRLGMPKDLFAAGLK